MPWIIDTDIFIEGERGNGAFVGWLQSADGIATADVVRGEFLIGAYAVADETIRQRGVRFYSEPFHHCQFRTITMPRHPPRIMG